MVFSYFCDVEFIFYNFRALHQKISSSMFHRQQKAAGDTLDVAAVPVRLVFTTVYGNFSARNTFHIIYSTIEGVQVRHRRMGFPCFTWFNYGCVLTWIGHGYC